MRIALTGGIACGKSLLSRYLEELGVQICDADQIVHELIPDPEERRRIAAEVFADPVKRKALEARIHPLVRKRLNEFSAAPSKNGESSAVFRIAVIPLLFEVHWESDYDIIAVVASPRSLQIERMMRTRGYSREQAEARLAAQMPVDEKARKSHYVIQNAGTSDDLRIEASRFVDWLKSQETQFKNHG